MDETDRSILELLVENARITDTDMATMLGIPEGEIRSRIDRLQKEKVIRKFTAVVDWERVGDGGVSAIIDLKVAPERDFGYDRVAERISRFRQVKSLRLVSGVYDLQLHVTGKTMKEVARFVAEQIAPIQNIRETATHIIMKTYKENGIPFHEREMAERLPITM
ncbi:MAG: Lrp/AsnC family transcriptional regulator [Methanomicrobiales archaeon]|nr:Lrp/AsnC family transcriptional regulator [Methanomicrobiales archaeon]